jgi:hypothetical protein
MWQENLILFAILAAGLSNLCLAAYVYLNGPKLRLNRSFTNVGIIICFMLSELFRAGPD